MNISTTSRRKTAHRLGLVAEELAAQFLQKQGYRILGQRVRTLAGEIDVLAYQKDTLVVVEVKARKHIEEGLWSVTRAKQKRLLRAAEALLQDNTKFSGLPAQSTLNIRFDVIIVTPNAAPLHVENAWWADSSP